MRFSFPAFTILLLSLSILNSTLAKEDLEQSDFDSRFSAFMDSSRANENRDFKKSLHFVEQAQFLSDSLNRGDWQVQVWNQFGRLYLKIGLIDLSAESYLNSISILEKKNVQSPECILAAKIGLGGVYLFLKDYGKSQKLFDESLDLLDSLKLDDQLSYSSIYNNMGIIYTRQDDLVRAYSILEKGIQLLENKEPENRNLPLLYNNLGDVFLKTNNYEGALIAYNRSLAIREERNDRLGIATTLKNIGLLHDQKGQTDQAISFFRSSLALSEELDAVVLQQIASQKLSELYKTQENKDSSLYYLEASIRLQDNINQAEAQNKLIAEEIRSLYDDQQRMLNETIAEKDKSFWLYLVTSIILFGFLILYLIKSLREKRLAAQKTKETVRKAQQLEVVTNTLQKEAEEKDKKLLANLVYEVKRDLLIKEAVEKLVSHRKTFTKDGQEVIRSVIHDLNNSQEDQVFNEFETVFTKLHQDFFRNLLAEFPDLTLNEKRLCAFLRLNLSTKEIISITGQTIPTLNKAKIRLRKKLGLAHTEQSLYSFLATF